MHSKGFLDSSSLTRGPDKGFQSLLHWQQIVERLEAFESLIELRMTPSELAAEFVHFVELLGEPGEPLLPFHRETQHSGKIGLHAGAQGGLFSSNSLRVGVQMMLITRAQIEQADGVEAFEYLRITHTRR